MWKDIIHTPLFYIALLLTKISFFWISLLKFGSGYTWPGHIAVKIFPSILKYSKINFSAGVVLISGTNGKTTTSKLLAHILEFSGMSVVLNKTGANLLNGIVSAILLDMSILGKHGSEIGVFEVDENTLPLLLEYVSPNVLVLLNLSRDQLDRYGEVDIILEKWEKAVRKLEPTTEIVLDKTQDKLKVIEKAFSGEVTYFDANLEYLELTNLVGKFNAKNVNAAVYTSMLVGIEEEVVSSSLKEFEHAYGRGETIEHKNKVFKIVLAKNPASFNGNLEVIVEGGFEFDALFFILNDNIPDGRDVSWIYDIEASLLKKACEGKTVFVAGTRFVDMVVRLKYARVTIKEENIGKDISHRVTNILKNSKTVEILCLPNYSAMLNLRKELTGKAIL